MALAHKRAVVLCIGSADRGDDGVGRNVARLLKDQLAVGDDAVVELDGEATSLLEQMERADAAYLIDACASGAPPGTIHRFDVGAQPLPEMAPDVSTHGFGLHAAIELARALGQLPARAVVFAVEGGAFAPGASLTEPVAAAAAIVAEQVCAEIAALSEQAAEEHHA